jgi:hypothetical protein
MPRLSDAMSAAELKDDDVAVAAAATASAEADESQQQHRGTTPAPVSRNMSVFGTTCLILNKMIGTGSA